MLNADSEHVFFDATPAQVRSRCEFSAKCKFRRGESAGLKQNGAGNGDLSTFIVGGGNRLRPNLKQELCSRRDASQILEKSKLFA